MILNDLKKVSCVMVTTGRQDLIKKSIACYARQTYKNKELVIVCQGTDEHNQLIEGVINALGRDDIQFVPAPPDITLGHMRNISLELTRGDIVCQWDDDDLYHPNRILSQYKALTSSTEYVGSFYSGFLKFFNIPEARQMYWVDWSREIPDSHKYLCGSAMFYKEMFYEFRNMIYPEYGSQCKTEEDLNVLEKLMLKGEIADVPDKHHYIYVYHGGNTYDLAHHQMAINTMVSQKVLASKEKLVVSEPMLRNLFENVWLDVPFDMCSDTDVAFKYEPKGV
jgi:glycosyltransferase involved in cell wall biosynthesis